MSARYLLPCPTSKCEYQFELVTKQAGQDLKCPKCDSDVEAPKLGVLRTLEMIGEVKTSKSSSGTKNWLFAGGLALAILAGSAGGWLYNYGSGMRSDLDIKAELVKFDEWADELTPYQVVTVFRFMDVEKGLGDWKEQDSIRYDSQGKILQGFSYGLMGIAGAGVLMLLCSFFMKK
ncbi:MAG: hypothetical protein AB8B55_19695 [Mariniblastus sp.]